MKSYLALVGILIIQVCLAQAQTEFFEKLSDAAVGLTNEHVIYDPNYYSIEYPNGDVPPGRGVCSVIKLLAITDIKNELLKMPFIIQIRNKGFFSLICHLN